MSSSSSPARSLHENDHHLNTMASTTIPHDDHHRPQPQQEQAEQPPVAMMKPPVKKQARRRTHASRPYQERLLNMAEARREIVTALKIHRANMRHQQPCTYQHRQADTLPPLRRQSPLQQLQQQEVQVAFHQDRSQAVEEEGALLAPASYTSYSDHQMRNNPLVAHWISSAAPAVSCYSSPILPYYDDTPLEAPMTTTAMGDQLEQLARSLPAQPLGLNLSFQGFGGSVVVDGASRDCEGLFGVPVTQSTTSPAASSSYSSPATEMASGTYGSPVLSSSTAEKCSSSVDAPAALIAPVLDDGRTQSAGETQGVEWWGEATTPAWWSKALLESMEIGGEVAEGGAVVGCTPEDVAAGLPAAEWRWLCDDSVVGEQGAVTGTDDKDKPPDFIEMLADGNYYASCYDDGRRCRSDGCDGITLPPCMDGIGDIGGSDGEWFSC